MSQSLAGKNSTPVCVCQRLFCDVGVGVTPVWAGAVGLWRASFEGKCSQGSLLGPATQSTEGRESRWGFSLNVGPS